MMPATLPNDTAWTILERMLLIRRFEEAVLKLSYDKKFTGHYHLYVGQEATGAGRLLADVEVIVAGGFLVVGELQHGLLEAADQQHPLKDGPGGVVGQGGGHHVLFSVSVWSHFLRRTGDHFA